MNPGDDKQRAYAIEDAKADAELQKEILEDVKADDELKQKTVEDLTVDPQEPDFSNL